MNRFSRQLWMAAALAALCPAVVRAQNYAYPPESAGGIAQAPDTISSITGGEGSAVCASCSDCSNGCCGCGCFGINWPCGCLLSDLGEAWKLCKPCCEDSQWSTTGW